MVFSIIYSFKLLSRMGKRLRSMVVYLTKEKDEPIPFATVGVQGTAIGTVTGFDGCFRLQVKNATLDTLVISTLGYDTRKYAVKTLDPKRTDLYILLLIYFWRRLLSWQERTQP